MLYQCCLAAWTFACIRKVWREELERYKTKNTLLRRGLVIWNIFFLDDYTDRLRFELSGKQILHHCCCQLPGNVLYECFLQFQRKQRSEIIILNHSFMLFSSQLANAPPVYAGKPDGNLRYGTDLRSVNSSKIKKLVWNAFENLWKHLNRDFLCYFHHSLQMPLQFMLENQMAI